MATLADDWDAEPRAEIVAFSAPLLPQTLNLLSGCRGYRRDVWISYRCGALARGISMLK
jgi:hypothetical protein